MRILVVDDEAAVRESLERSLRFEGSKIGLRRSLGATRGHVRVQFLAEALLLAILGGVGGVLVGAVVTAGYATGRGWRIVVPASAVAAGIGAALLVGAAAGLYPAVRAARLPPTEALRSV
jgi:putative ABC transport system permease protein